MRARRIENEWLLLEALQQANPGRLQLTRHPDSFAITATHLPALLEAPANPANPGAAIHHTHHLRVTFPRYYPSMPVEVYLDTPVFHPNVHPDTGFVCLWTKHRIQTTLEQTLSQLQRVLNWTLLNTDPEHVMQPAALLWYQQPNIREHLPLASTPFVPVHAEAWQTAPPPLRRRLS
ncbi:ubiquitin-conjugating enzyme E2 variant [Granulicella arctica]|uniref:Ubiquitin-protein ligase n=1 Tax=Granulicella arctica TaxID=940613 RepID=A0A7Y9PFC6_9BACT|nr:ubiquitin-conjugating enzyme E2 [Granulicella arctica]NYF78660.1 ubiquitin-protein ligase [Granulicella arctica]